MGFMKKENSALSVFSNERWFFVFPVAAEPDLVELVVSNITSDRLSLSWRTGGKSFDNFVVEVRESALPSRATGRTLPGGVRSTVITGLKGATRYDIKLYARSGGQNTLPLTAVATTGTPGHLSLSCLSIPAFIRLARSPENSDLSFHWRLLR